MTVTMADTEYVVLQVFTTFFLFEAILKLAALSKEYFGNGWNIFDLVIVVAGIDVTRSFSRKEVVWLKQMACTRMIW